MAETCELARLRANLLVCFCSLVSLLRHLVRLGLCAVWCSLCFPVFLSVVKVELLTFFSPPSGVQVILHKDSYSQWLASPATSVIIIPGHCLHCRLSNLGVLTWGGGEKRTSGHVQHGGWLYRNGDCHEAHVSPSTLSMSSHTIIHSLRGKHISLTPKVTSFSNAGPSAIMTSLSLSLIWMHIPNPLWVTI